MLKLESDCVGTMYANVHGQEIPIAYLISEVRWQKGCTNYEELKERCNRIELDDKALKTCGSQNQMVIVVVEY